MSDQKANQEALRGHVHDRVAEDSENENTYLIPTQRGNMPQSRYSQKSFFDKEQGDTTDIAKGSETFTSSEDQVLEPKSRDISKAHKLLGYPDDDQITPKKSTTDQVTTPKARNEKKFFSKLFHRKGSKEPTTPPSSSSENSAGRRIISAPTLVDASPNAKGLLKSARSLIDDSPVAKNAVNYSRPMALRSMSDVFDQPTVARSYADIEPQANAIPLRPSINVSRKSPIAHGYSDIALHGSNTTSHGPSIDESSKPLVARGSLDMAWQDSEMMREGLTAKSEDVLIGLDTSSVSHISDLRLPRAK